MELHPLSTHKISSREKSFVRPPKAEKIPKGSNEEPLRFRIWIVLLFLLLMPAMQVGVVRFLNPPRTLPMMLEQVS
jgi:hypothetical protein